jgi:hypothetical protein
VTKVATASEPGHPESCPWCGRPQIRGVWPSPNGDRLYRCVACGTRFFIHQLSHPAMERSRPAPVAATVDAPRRLVSRFAHKR